MVDQKQVLKPKQITMVPDPWLEAMIFIFLHIYASDPHTDLY